MKQADSTWLTVKEAAEQAKVSTWTIYRACELGELGHVRLGGRRAIRLTRQALDDWLLQHERVPVGSTPGAATQGWDGKSQSGPIPLTNKLLEVRLDSQEGAHE